MAVSPGQEIARMVETAAVVAHFDPDDALDPTFAFLLGILREYCNPVILVTTSRLQKQDYPEDTGVITICRPNVGYDFYSYRVGLDEIMGQGGCKRLLMLNSSFLVLDPLRFRATLDAMLSSLQESDIVGITSSRQWSWHLQTYLLALRGDLLAGEWFREWLDGIRPCNSKMETIISGELGFSGAIRKARLGARPLFRLSGIAYIRACWGWTTSGGFREFILRSVFGGWRAVNPVHFSARRIAESYGFVKTELLRDNPHGIDLNWVDTICSPELKAPLADFLARTGKRYRTTDTGLTVLHQGMETALTSCRILQTGAMARQGVRIAVAVHLFYPELLEDVATVLRSMPEPCDLLVTTPHEGAIPAIIDTLAPLIHGSVMVALCENRGRDIRPFMTLHRRRLLEPYDAILKLHTKRSTYSEHGANWQRILFKSLAGSSLIVRQILQILRSGDVGLVGPHQYYLTNPDFWGANRQRLSGLMHSLGHPGADNPQLGFFGGSMFWFVPPAFTRLHDIPEELLQFEPEAGQQDGTLAHAIERLFCQVARQAGYRSTSLQLQGSEIADTCTDGNNVPVL